MCCLHHPWHMESPVFVCIIGRGFNMPSLSIWNVIFIFVAPLIIITGHLVCLLTWTILCLSNSSSARSNLKSKYCSFFLSGFPDTCWSDLYSELLTYKVKNMHDNTNGPFLVTLGKN
ncbi:hypothetical protein CRENBAI_006995 [Crenichthys baileyi]|uniref:Uncharacterized protein n=1 Tax=Crenichthys baileyi TaxID=28760 RepID=A0AAV9RU46_9TELE